MRKTHGIEVRLANGGYIYISQDVATHLAERNPQLIINLINVLLNPECKEG